MGVRVVDLPSGTVTFLFTDIEGSTRLWEEHPDAMRDALARHDEVLREAIEAHRGYVVKTTGDGFHAAFGAADAGGGRRSRRSVNYRRAEPGRRTRSQHGASDCASGCRLRGDQSSTMMEESTAAD